MTTELRICVRDTASLSPFLPRLYTSASTQTLQWKCQRSPSAKTACSSSPSFLRADVVGRLRSEMPLHAETTQRCWCATCKCRLGQGPTDVF